MSTIDANGLLLQMRALASRAQGAGFSAGESQGIGEVGASNGVDFSRALRSALDGVNAAQHNAESLATRFEAGDTRVELSQVMVADQKANLSFQAASQIRNKLVSAYQDIMNMPI